MSEHASMTTSVTGESYVSKGSMEKALTHFENMDLILQRENALTFFLTPIQLC